MNSRWFAIDVEIDRAAEEVVNWALWSFDPTGIETTAENIRTVTLSAYYESCPSLDSVCAKIDQALADCQLTLASIRRLEGRWVQNEDWLAKWKEGYEPFRVGHKFVITPSWKKVSKAKSTGRFIIQLDPGMAFGTGTHETTKLCLKAIERHSTGGRFLDVGTGTGILAI